uniref:Poly [ADP-ribose] polymerase n=1 Tax=Stegastes partitus TaxID=144197 RepID=A0A3B5AGG8_9TELE
MADAGSYPLLVELEENSLPKLKNKLVKYFQSKKSNGGGDCEVEYEDGSRTALLRFRSEKDQRNVLAKASHQISVGQSVLKMTVRLPTEEKTTKEASSDKDNKTSQQLSADEHHTEAEVETEAEGRDDDTADEELCSTSAVLGNVPETASQEFLEMLVENIISESYILEIFRDTSSAVVTFQSGKENTDFVTKCPQNKMFKKKALTVRPLELTQQVVVEDIGSFNEDMLRLYFEKKGGDVETVVLNEVEQSAVVTFKDPKAVSKILKTKHCIKQQEIRVFPFYQSLGIVLYGKDKPSLKLPAVISEPIDNTVWKYLRDNQSAAETIRSDLAKHFCNVNLDQPTVRLSPVSSLLQQKEAKILIKEWRDTVKSAFAKAVSEFQSLKFHPKSDVWEETEEKIRAMLKNEDAVVVPDKANGVLSVGGPVNNVNRLEKTISEVIDNVAKRVQREKASVTQEIKVPPSVFHILCQDGLKDKLLCVYPELKMSFGEDSSHLKVTGIGDEIFAANKVILEAMFALKRQTLELDKYVLDLLKKEQQEELTKALLISKGINAAFEINPYRVQLLAVSDKDLNDAEDHLQRLLKSEYIDVEDTNVLEKPEWQCLVSKLESDNSKSCSRTRIHTTSKQVVVSGPEDSVRKVSRELDNFLTQNAQVEETAEIKPNVIVEYIRNLNTSWLEKLEDKVVVSYRKDAICLSGSRVDVVNCKTLVENLVSSVFFDTLEIPKPGGKKFFQDNETMYVSTLKTETGCLVQLVDETADGQNDSARRQVPKPVYQVETTDGVEIAVCKADVCSYPVHAVVNASNEILKDDGDLSTALLNAAGPQLQDELDRQISLKGQLKPGDCVIAGAGGQLRCKKIIHAQLPHYDSAKPQKAVAQLKRAVKGSLELAEMDGCISVALPAVSSALRFPLSVCASTIVKAVKEYCDEKYEDNTLRRIHLVNNDDSVVQAMEKAVRQEFGNNGVSHSQQTLPTTSTKSTLVKSAGSTPFLFQVQTKEGVCITLTKGHIEAATTEVIVNTVSEDLALNKGAVSNAILSAAGSKLQQLVTASNASGTIGEVVVTDGCKLKSKQVFHAVLPRWDSGSSAAKKTLTGILKDCLGKAEDTGLTSISFPAFGTGNLGFPKDVVVSLMLDKILSFSSKNKPKHLKKIVIVLYPKDAQTIQVFSDEFKKKFPNASSGSVSTSSTPSAGGPFSKVASSSGMHEAKMGRVTVQVVTGDITKETTDVIVNSSNDDFSLKSGVSKAILDAAGQAVEAECQTLGAQSNTDMIMTQPGNLQCKKILHLVGRTDPVKINEAVKDALQMCVKNYTSISFPAIGTGQGNVQARQVADAMLDAVIEVLSQNTSSTLTTVRIVIFQAPMLKEFYNSMQERETPDPKPVATPSSDPKDKGWWENIGSKIKSFFVSERTEKLQMEGDIVIEGLQVDPACFHICGDTQADVDLAKQWIDNLISTEQTSVTISDYTIISFSGADHQQIVEIQKTLGVSIKTEIINAQASVTIEGLSKDVLQASNQIHQMLKKVRDEEEMKRKVELASTVVDWQYQQQGSQFQSFDAKTNFELERALKKNLPNVKVKVLGQDYTVAMPSGPAADSTGSTLQIKRIDKLKDEDVAEQWDTMPDNTTSLAVTITAGTPEHTEILNLFQASCNRTVTKIERIQNPTLWSSYQIKKRDMELRNGHQNNEKRLFHGTCEATATTINELGFNRSYAGKNATCFGKGSYFAVNASYSASDTYSQPNQNGEKLMYVCQVLTGDYTVGKADMIAPPDKGTSSVQNDTAMH